MARWRRSSGKRNQIEASAAAAPFTFTLVSGGAPILADRLNTATAVPAPVVVVIYFIVAVNDETWTLNHHRHRAKYQNGDERSAKS